MKLTVVIVNYNVRYFLEQALLSVRSAIENIAAEVYVVDNNSSDDSVAMVEEKFPDFQLIANTDNPGFSIANNQAIRASEGEYVLLLNPDTLVAEDTFERCIDFMDKHPQAGGLGVRMIDGAGIFLPESKRGFPSPWVAFAKSFGLAGLFPKSPLFNHYHLGYLSEKETHEVDVLSGAFMFLRRSVLDKIGLLDEAFFMYGEDIDLSYRIVKADYRNYYFSETSIVHYKGESTKKGSLNYVKAFYQAMIIFARKHFHGRQARLFVLMLQGAIYLRAGMTLVSNFLRRMFLPLLEGLLMFGGLLFIQDFWASFHFKDSHYYDAAVHDLTFPLYVLLWLISLFFAGAYDEPFRLRRMLRGLAMGTLLLAAIYGLLDPEYRSSRAIILMGAAWAVVATLLTRTLLFFGRYKSLAIGQEKERRLILAGEQEESKRALELLQKAGVRSNIVGRVTPTEPVDTIETLGLLANLATIVKMYKIEEIIFCAKDVPAKSIIHWMSTLGPQFLFKIISEGSQSIIGSHSKNSSGELYTVDIQFQILHPIQKRNKRLFDLGFALLLLLTYPLQLLLVRRPFALLKRIAKTIIGQETWVGYLPVASEMLPKLSPGVLNPVAGLNIKDLNSDTRHRLNMLYAKDYQLLTDIEIVWRAWRELGG